MSLVQPHPRASLELKPMRVPNPGPGRVVVRVATSTMNSLDHKIIAYGILAQEWPWVGGNEYAGTVAAIGPHVENLKIGDRIVAAAVNFIEGPEVSGWQQYALLRADLCTKIPDHVPFEKACTVPTSFAAASIALAIELGLKYPDAPPLPPKKTAADVWENAMASLGGGATFDWNLKDGVVEGGAWYPNPKAHMIQGPPPTPEQLARKAEEERTRVEEERKKAKTREEEEDRLQAGLSRAMAEELKKRSAMSQPTGVPGPSQPSSPHYVQPAPRSIRPGTTPDPWDKTNPMSWGSINMTHEAMDKRWGSGWEDGGANRRLEVVEERRDPRALGLVTSGQGLGLDLGPGTSRTGSGGPSRRGSASLPAWAGAEASLSSPGFRSIPERPPSVRPGSGGSARPSSGGSVRPNSGGSIRHGHGFVARPQTPGRRGSTSPFRISTHRGHLRGHGSPPYPPRTGEHSPLAGRFAGREARGDRHFENIDSALTRHSPDRSPTSSVFQSYGGVRSPLRELVPVGTPWSGAPSTVGPHGDSFCPRPLVRMENSGYLLDEPILVWGGSTGVGRAALQLLKRAGYTNLFVVAASERHAELKAITPPGTKFFDYRHSDVVVQISAALGAQKFNKVLDTVSMPYTLEPIAQLVSSGAKVAAVLPVNTPMPEGVVIKPVMYGRCNDYSGKDILSFNFGKDAMWPLLGEILRKNEWVFPPMMHLPGGSQVGAMNASRMMSTGENAGRRLVFDV